MGLFDFFSRTPHQWQVHLFNGDGTPTLSQPSDRAGAASVVVCARETGAKLDRVTYAGKTISPTQREDLVADAELLNLVMEAAMKQGIPVQVLLQRGPDKSQSKAVFTEATRRVSQNLCVTEQYASEVLLRRLQRGSLVALAQQQTP